MIGFVKLRILEPDDQCVLRGDRLKEAMMEDIAQTQPQLDYILYTGDSPAHDIWIQSKDRNLENELTVLDMIDSHFPGVPVYLGIKSNSPFSTLTLCLPSSSR